MALRAVVNANAVVIADGTAEFSVAGADYNGVGTWENFEYESYPVCSQDVIDYVATLDRSSSVLCYKVVGGAIEARSLAEIEASPLGE